MSDEKDEITLPQLLDELTRQIVELQDGRIVNSIGSGFLWNRPAKSVVLLSVAHTCRRPVRGDVLLSLGLHGNNRGMFVAIPDIGSFRAITVTPSISTHDVTFAADVRDIDFAWAEYPRPAIAVWEAEVKKHRLIGTLGLYGGDFAEPTTASKFHFAAREMTDLHVPTGAFDWIPLIQFGMTFDGVQYSGKYAGMYRFLPTKQFTHLFKGSSGAPILNDDGTPVAMVAAGSPDAGVIFGCPLLPYVRYIDQLA